MDSLLFDNVNPEMMARVPEPFDNNSEIDQQYGELYGVSPEELLRSAQSEDA